MLFLDLLRSLGLKACIFGFCLPAVLTTNDSTLAGHIGELFGPNSEQFRKDITENYGKVVKLRGLFNVSLICSLRCIFLMRRGFG